MVNFNSIAEALRQLEEVAAILEPEMPPGEDLAAAARRLLDNPGNPERTATLLTERQLARQEGVSVRTLQDWRRRGTGPRYRKLGDGKRALVRYPIAWVEEWRAATGRDGFGLGRRC